METNQSSSQFITYNSFEYDRLPGLQVKDYEYPGETNAFDNLKKIPLLDQVTAAYLGYYTQTGLLSVIQGDCYRITERTSPKVYALYQKALHRLDIDQEFPLFAKGQYDYNAAAGGGDKPFIFIHSSLLSDFKEEELLFILGHEIGHIKSGHLIYYEMATQLNLLLRYVPVPGIELAIAAIQYSIMQWGRMQEYTADRAGVIAAGSIEAGMNGLGCLLGKNDNIPNIHIEIEDYLKQNVSFEETNDNMIGKVLNAFEIMDSSHPWLISRIKKLNDWKISGKYDQLLEKYGVKG